MFVYVRYAPIVVEVSNQGTTEFQASLTFRF